MPTPLSQSGPHPGSARPQNQHAQQPYYPQAQPLHHQHQHLQRYQQHQQQPSPPASSSSSSQQTQAHLDRAPPSQPIGRSQSAFNFLLNKAKAPFSSSSSSSTLNASTSLSSLSVHQEDPFDDTTNHIQYHRQLQNDHAFPQAPPSAPPARRTASGGIEKAARSHPLAHDASQPSKSTGAPFSRPSYSEDQQNAVASPTKRGFFGGIGRDRKASTASIKQPAPHKPNFSHSPLSKPQRTDATMASNYAHFSKSQSDLHSRADYPSPTNMTVELPRVPAVYHNNTAQPPIDRNRYLRSPSPAMNFSRSVDDLSIAEQQPASPYPISPAHGESSSSLATAATSTSPGTWGEHGIPVPQPDWRPSDMGTLASPTHQSAASFQRFKPGHNKLDSVASQLQPSSGSVHSPPHNWSGMSPPQHSYMQSSAAPSSARADAKHARKASKLMGKDSSARGAVATSLAASLGLTHLGAASAAAVPPLSILTSAEPVPLPPGAAFQGFLARNANISLTLAQLSGHDHGKGKDKEKDVTKGWKPYRVVLQDGRLCFYKPPSNISDDVKALFPTGIVRGVPDTPASSASISSLTADQLVRSGLSKQDLLSATSSTAEMTSPLASPSLRPRLPSARPNKSATTPSEVPTTPVAVPQPAEVDAPRHQSWLKPGKHPDLVLVDTVDAPPAWADRIQAGTLEALAHEFVHATQFPTEQAEAQASRRSILPSPLVPGSRAAASSAESAVESFVVAVLANASSAKDAPQGANKQISAFFLDVVKQAEELTSAGTDVTQSISASVPSLASRLRTLLDVATRAGLFGILTGDTLKKLAVLVSMDIDELDNKMQIYASPILSLSDAQSSEQPRDWIARLAEKEAASAREDLRKLRSSLELSDDLLLQLEPLEIAQQIQAFHVNALRRLVLSGTSFLDLLHPIATDADGIAALSFDSLSPHPLTTLALSHLLKSSSSAQDAPNAAQNGARHRASVLRHWIAIASYLLSLGDVAGWMAVCAALCSRAVTRLEQTWRYLAEGDRVLVAEEWAPILSSLSWTEGLAVHARPRFVGDGTQSFTTSPDGTKIAVVPYLGSAFYRTLRQPNTPSPSPSGLLSMSISSRAEDAAHLWVSVNEWRSAWQGEPSLALAAHSEPVEEYQAALQLLFQNSNTPVSTMESNMERSFQLEPRALGNIDAGSLDARERLSLPSSADADLPLVPLLFPQPLPLLSLLNTSQIKASLVRRNDPRANQIHDPQATITSRSMARPSLAGSPLARASAFSPPLGRSSRNAAFSGVVEWSSISASTKWDDASNGAVKIGNELVLRLVQEANLSLPGSPMTSKRFSQDFGRASRPLSQVSKRSSLPASNRSSVIDIVVPVQVVVKAATLDRMIDLLVMGVQHINVPPISSPMDGPDQQSAPQRKTRLVMDMESYRTTFLATFRSLCSAPELFEQLQKRFSTAIMASKELAGADEFRSSSQFPSWIGVIPAGSQAEPTDWEMVYRIRMGVVLTLRLWIDRFPQDFVDDDDLYHLALNFLRHPGMEVTAEDPDQQKVVHALAQLRSMFGSRIMGANARQEERSYATNMAVQISDSRQQADFDFDRASAAELVEYLESIATVFFDKIVDRDLLVVSEIFEKQAIQPTAWYTVKSASTPPGEEDKPVTNIYTLLDVLRAPAGTNADASKDSTASLQLRLPSAIRDALAAQSLFRGWIAIHIIESGIGLERRQERLSKLLDALWLCRARMLKLRGDETTATANAQAGNAGPIADTSLPFREPTIGSFVESAIVNTLGSSESRIFLRAWQGVAAARGGRGDGIDDLMPKQIDADLRSAVDMAGTPDIGWILACLAEAATRAPSVPTSTSDVELIDFEKRRTMWALIDGAVRVRPACTLPDLVDLAGARLRLMQSALTRVIWDRRAFREDAAKEMRNAPPVRSDAKLRPTTSSKALSGLSKQQQEKLRRDRAALELLKSLPLAPPISSRVSSMPSSRARASNVSSTAFPSMPQSSDKAAMVQAPPPDKATIRARRMTALFKGAVRPLISLDKPNESSKPTAELMRLTPLQKPSLVAGLGGARVSVWNNAQRSFVFHLTSQEGAKYLLQTTNAADLAEWISQIERASKEYAAPQLLDARKGGVPSKTRAGPAPLYARPLAELAEREGHSVPTAVERMFAEVEARGLREQGIYRISGSKSAVENLRTAWDQQPAESIDLSTGEFSDVHTIAGAIKAWLRELPEPLITFDSYDALIATNAMENDDRLYAMRDIIWKMPKCHFDVLRRTAEHLARVVEEGEINKMLAHNVALVFGTSLLNPPPGPSSVAIGFGNLGKAANVVKTIVTMHEWLFEPEPEPEPEPEAEAEAEAEGEAEAEAEGQRGVQQTADVDHANLASASATEVDVEEASCPVESIKATRPRGASISSSQDSQPGLSKDVTVLTNQQDEEQAQADEEEASILTELAPRPRRGGRTRPLTIVGLDGLAALGANEDIAKVLESGTSPVAEASEGEDGTSESQPSQAAPRIVLSGAGDESDREAEADEGSDSGGDDSHEQDAVADATEVGSEAAQVQEKEGNADEASGAAASARPRKTRSTYRDSVFTSYSIYADCFDNMKLESQSSAASMVKRQSMHLLNSPPVAQEAATGDATVTK